MKRAAVVRPTWVLALLALAGPLLAQTPVGSAFTYQGRLLDNGSPANGPHDLGFSLYDAPSGGTPLGTITLPAVQVSGGLFTVRLDFGVAPFVAGQARWLEIQVTPPGGPILAPRQELTPSPSTLFSSYTDPAHLTSLDAGNLTSGTVPDARLAGTYSQPLSLTNPGNAVAGNGAAITSLDAGNLASGTVPGGRIAGAYPNAVTFSSPGNSFTGDGAGLTNLNAQPRYVRTVVVSPVGAPAANGTALLAALAGITTASAANPWLLKIEPGVYDVGLSSFVMKPFVDVEGSGETATRITGTGHATNDVGTVQAVTSSELRFVTVESVGGAFAKALYVSNASPRISHVTVLASGATAESQGLYSDNGAVPTVTGLRAFASASGAAASLGVLDVGSSSQLFHVVSNSNGGGFSRAFFACCGAAPIIRHSVGVASGATTENHGVALYDASSTLEYVTGIATGPAVNNLGVLVTGAGSAPVLRQVTCRGVGATGINWGCLTNVGAQPNMSEITADAFGGTVARGLEDDFAGAGASLSKVRAGASGGSSENRGVRISNCSPRAVNIEAFASGSGTATVYGLYVANGSPDVSHVTATAGGASTNATVGVYLEGATAAPTLSHATASATGGGPTWGLLNNAAGGPSVRDSVFSAAGPSQAVGVYSGQGATLVNVSGTASGSANNFGGFVFNNPAVVRFVNARLVGTGGSTGSGLIVSGTGTVNVDRSTLNGTTSSIHANDPATIRVAVSQLVNPVNNFGGATFSCLGSYNGSYSPLNATCQ